jgi:hypothetical protein
MEDYQDVLVDEDGEIHFIDNRKSKPKYRRWGNTSIIAAMIGAASVIAAAFISISVPIGEENKPPICYIINSNTALCNGSITTGVSDIRTTQIAIEQLQTALAETQIAIEESQITDPVASPAVISVSPSVLPSEIPAVIATQPILITATVHWNTTKEIHSDKLWQDTGLDLRAGDKVLIEVVNGRWKKSPNEAYNNGSGTGYICGGVLASTDCVEPMPMYPTDALIGRVGDQIFLIGQRVEITVEQNGQLSMRMNDGDFDIFDNEGSLTVGVLVLT